jgi:carboxyl-terminal processing protease
MRVNVLTLALVAGLLFAGCKKNHDSAPTPPTSNDSLKDSVLLYTKDLYLWYKNIPESFSASGYADPNAIMEAVRQYSSEPGFTGPVDRWSFAVTQHEWDDLSGGVSTDFGMGIFFNAASDLRVSYVEKESPAGKAGVSRSWRIKTINNNSDITTGNASFIVNAVYQSTTGTFVFTKPSGTDTTITLTAGVYQEHPIYVDSVYTAGASKVGYMVLNSFLGDTTEIKSEFQRVFNKFNSQSVNEVVIDLRYNGGGFVSLQNELANYLVPTAGNNGLMETEQFNDKYTDFNETINFKKKGTLNLSRVFIIVSQNTASASELLINSLKPYMNVQLVGPSATHGKPVGFFPIPVGDWYIFPVSFRTINKNGEGNYFNGLSVNSQVADGLTKSWGDVSESCLASALHFISSGSYARVGVVHSEGLTSEVQKSNTVLDGPRFKGAVNSRHRF